MKEKTDKLNFIKILKLFSAKNIQRRIKKDKQQGRGEKKQEVRLQEFLSWLSG